MESHDSRTEDGSVNKLAKYYTKPNLLRELLQFHEFLAVDLAHTVMLVEQRILSREHGALILKELLSLRELGPERFGIDAQRGSFLFQVESYLAERLGEDVAGRMHTGRSRIDQGATVRRLFKRRRMFAVMTQLLALQEAMRRRAEEHSSLVMPGYTHMQHAQPWVLGHYLLSFIERFSDDFRRLTEVFVRVNRSPLGAAGLAGTSWPLDRNRTAHLLGFHGLLENSRNAREAYYAAEIASALSFVMADMNDIATDLHLWSSREFGFVELSDEYCGKSSIFPQKKNPVALEIIKAKAGPAVNWLGSALAIFRSEGSGDQAIRSVPLIDEAFDTTEGMLDLAIGVIGTFAVHEQRIMEALQDSWLTASNLADVLVRECGLSFRHAHQIVSKLVRSCLAAGIPPSRLSGDTVARTAKEVTGRAISVSDALVQSALDPQLFVRSRVTTGSVAAGEIERMLDGAKLGIAAQTEWLERQKAQIAAAQRELETAARGIIH